MRPITFDSLCYRIKGKPVYLNSGEFHYFRVPKKDWRERMELFKKAGGNCLGTYIPWIVHEPEEGNVIFGDEIRDLEGFFETANEMGLYVMARPGPYQYSELKYCGLLTACFRKPQDVVFNERRFFKEPPRHRWLMRSESGLLIANVAVHEKIVESEGETMRIAGIAEVCVHPDFQRKGLAKRMLAETRDWISGQDFFFAVLYGNPQVYCSSGYSTVNNLCHDVVGADGSKRRELSDHAMVMQMGSMGWPEGEVHLPGPTF